MKLIKIQSSKDPLIAQVPELYESAFSEAERTDTERFLWMIDHCQEWSLQLMTSHADASPSTSVTVFMLSWRIPES